MNLLVLVFALVFSGVIHATPIRERRLSGKMNPIFAQPQNMLLNQQHPIMQNNIFFQQQLRQQQQQQPFMGQPQQQFAPKPQQFMPPQQQQFMPQHLQQFVSQQAAFMPQPTFLPQPQTTFIQQPAVLQTQTTFKPVQQQQPVAQPEPVVTRQEAPVQTVTVVQAPKPVVIETIPEKTPVTTQITTEVATQHTPLELHDLLVAQNDDLNVITQLIRHHVEQNRIIMDEIRSNHQSLSQSVAQRVQPIQIQLETRQPAIQTAVPVTVAREQTVISTSPVQQQQTTTFVGQQTRFE